MIEKLNMDDHQNTFKSSTCFHLLPNLILTFLIWMGLLIIFGMRCVMDMLNKDARYTEAFTDDIRNKMNSLIFWGYLLGQIPGGFLVMKFSARKLLGVAIFTSCLLFFFVPASLEYDPIVTKCIRFVQGLMEGLILPSCYSIWAYSIPALLRTTLVAFAFSGCYLGILLGRILTEELIKSVTWQSLFYLYGGSGVIWLIFWMLFFLKGSQKFLNSNMRQSQANIHESSRQQISTLYNIPWKAFVKSGPIWAFFTAHFSKSWFFFVVIFVGDVYSTVTPEINKDPIFKIMQLVMVVTVIIAGISADCLRRCLGITVVRKLYCCVPFLIEAFASVVAVYTGNKYITVYSTFISIVANGISISGFNVNLLDIAPKYACLLIGFSNTIGILGSCIYFLIDYQILHGKTVWKQHWELLYLMAAIWHSLAAVVYLFVGSGELQPWASTGQVENQRPRHTAECTMMVELPANSPNNHSNLS